jgi:tripartite-type tricarboxylate transporter receptor subunit TctC
MPYAMSELEPISLVSTASAMLAVATHVPAKTVSEFIALAKSKCRGQSITAPPGRLVSSG